MGWSHANMATGALGGAPYGATKRVRGVPKWVGRSHVTIATGAMNGASFWGRETGEGCAENELGGHMRTWPLVPRNV
eukprot:3939380-Pyramimonas_sp.AAC.1